MALWETLRFSPLAPMKVPTHKTVQAPKTTTQKSSFGTFRVWGLWGLWGLWGYGVSGFREFRKAVVLRV